MVAVAATGASFAWLWMQWTHELGHVLGAWATGGDVNRVVLDPQSFSRTDVHPNPQPLVTVWAGPVVGSVVGSGIPMLGGHLLPNRRGICWLVASFCLFANGSYIGLGVIEPIADTAVMVSFGTPKWMLAIFGIACYVLGRWMTVRGVRFAKTDDSITGSSAVSFGVLAMAMGVVGLSVFPA